MPSAKGRKNTPHNHHQNFMCDNLVSESSGNFYYTHPFTGTLQNPPRQEDEAMKATLKRLQNEWISGEGGGEKERGGLSFTVNNPC